MYDETNVPGPDYQVRPVVRYAVTAYYHSYKSRDGSHGSAGSHKVLAECDSPTAAEELVIALETSYQAMVNLKRSEQAK